MEDEKKKKERVLAREEHNGTREGTIEATILWRHDEGTNLQCPTTSTIAMMVTWGHRDCHGASERDDLASGFDCFMT